MKCTFAVVSNGEHIANQVAGSSDRAVQIVAGKRGLNPRYMRAIDFSNTPNITKAIELACLETINFEPCSNIR